MTARRASLTAVAGVSAVALLLALLVVWAASIGPSVVLDGQGPPRITVQESSPSSPTASGSPRQSDIERELNAEHHSPGLRVLGMLLLLALALAALWLLQRAWRRAVDEWRSRRRPPPRPDEVDFDVLDPPEQLAEEIARDAEWQRQLLLTGAPRNGIVAAWDRFELQAATVGLGRLQWETPTEFTLRVLESVHADDQAVSTLAGLYHEARFSTHEVDEHRRQVALDALAAIHAGLASGRVR
jgi:hypothetical protein